MQEFGLLVLCVCVGVGVLCWGISEVLAALPDSWFKR